MSTVHCVGSLQVCGIRVRKLTAGGTPAVGPQVGYVSDAIVEANLSIELSAGDDFELKNGCGDIAQQYKDCDKVKRVNVDMEFSQLDNELVGLLTGGDVFSTGGMDPVTIGGALLSSTDSCQTGVAMELYTKAWDNNQQMNAALIGGSASDVVAWRWFFPFVRFQLGNLTLQNDILRIPVSGYAQENSQMPAAGPFDDFPTAIVNAGGITTPMGWFMDEESNLPDPGCGYVAFGS
jgi:hypothetical protein